MIGGLIGRLHERAQRGDRFAVYPMGPGEVSYERLVADAWRFARRLEDAGAQRGAVVAVISRDPYELAVRFFGAILSRAIPMLLPPPSPKIGPDRYRAMLGDLLSTTVDFVSSEDDGIDTLSNGFRELPKRTAAVNLARLENFPGMRVDDEVQFIQNSSGTSGLQKGVPVTTRMLQGQIESLARATRFSVADKVVSWLPLYHDMGLVACLLLPVLKGGELIQLDTFRWLARPEELLRAVSFFRATLVWQPNFAFQFLAERCGVQAQAQGYDLSSLRMVVNCSEPISDYAMNSFWTVLSSCGVGSGNKLNVPTRQCPRWTIM